ncbi:MAG: NUDIX hydrolase [Nitrososphaerales archaeon]
MINSRVEFTGRRMFLETRTFSLGKEKHLVNVLNFKIPRSTAILPVTRKGRILLESHFRFGIQEEILEIPAGWLEEEEDPSDAARRELVEETGFKALKLKSLGSIFPAASYSAEEIFLFQAEIEEKTANKQALEKGELISLKFFSKSSVRDMIKSGKIKDVMTISALYRSELLGTLD